MKPLIVSIVVFCLLARSGSTAETNDRFHAEMLNRSDVRHELELTDDQIEGLLASAKPTVAKIMALMSERALYSQDEFNAKSIEIGEEQARNMRSAREAILLPHQLKRLNELGWLYRAVRESTRAFVEGLGLTADEARQLLAIENEQGAKLHEELWEFHHRAQREFLEILSPEQRVEWAKRTGQAFRFAPRAPGLSLLMWLR